MSLRAPFIPILGVPFRVLTVLWALCSLTPATSILEVIHRSAHHAHSCAHAEHRDESHVPLKDQPGEDHGDCDVCDRILLAKTLIIPATSSALTPSGTIEFMTPTSHARDVRHSARSAHAPRGPPINL